MVAVAGATPPVEGGATMTATSSMADQLLDDYWNEFLFTVTGAERGAMGWRALDNDRLRVRERADGE